MEYQATLRCESCKRETPHHFWAEGREWYCCVCDHANDLSDALADVADALTRVIRAGRPPAMGGERPLTPPARPGKGGEG